MKRLARHQSDYSNLILSLIITLALGGMFSRIFSLTISNVAAEDGTSDSGSGMEEMILCQGEEDPFDEYRIPVLKPEESIVVTNESEWLALEAGFYHEESFRADKQAAKKIMLMLEKIRLQFPEVKHVFVAEERMRYASVSFVVAQDGKSRYLPPEAEFARQRFGASYWIQYGETDYSPAHVQLFFDGFMHFPSLTNLLSKSERISNIENYSRGEVPDKNHLNNVSASFADGLHRFVFASHSGNEGNGWLSAFFYFTVDGDMKIVKVGERVRTEDRRNGVREIGITPW